MLANCLILFSVSFRRAHLHRQTYWSQWARQIRRHGHLFLSPTLTIASLLFLIYLGYEFFPFQICILPQLTLSLKFSCVDITSKWLLRLNISVNLIVYIIQAATFLLFILPSQVYFEIFRTQSYIGKHFCHRRARTNLVAPQTTRNSRLVMQAWTVNKK